MEGYSEPLLRLRLGFPPSTNHAYGLKTVPIGGGKFRAQSYMKESGLRYKQQVMVAVKESCPDFTIPEKKPLYLRLVFLCSPATLNKRDLDNNLKLLIDALFHEGGGNDRYVRELIVTKEPHSEDAVEVDMREILKEDKR